MQGSYHQQYQHGYFKLVARGCREIGELAGPSRQSDPGWSWSSCSLLNSKVAFTFQGYLFKKTNSLSCKINYFTLRSDM